MALTVQLASAVGFVGGLRGTYVVHSNLAAVVLALGIAQAIPVMSVNWLTPRKLYQALAVAVVVGEVAQRFLIPRGELALHVTVAMGIWVAGLAIFIRLLDSALISAATNAKESRVAFR